MIKVNLLHDRSKAKQKGAIASGSQASVITGSGTAFKDIFGDDGEAQQTGGQAQSAIKILIMISFTAGLYYYERVQVKSNEAQIVTKQMEVEEVESLLADKRSTIENLEDLKTRFEDERQFIEATRKELISRMHFVRGLDAIQSSIVPNLWLTNITYDRGSYKIDGRALYKSDLDDFYGKLNKIPYFNKAIIVKDSEAQSQNGAYEFSIVTEAKEKALGGV